MRVKAAARQTLFAISLCVIATHCLAQELVGCDKFKWPLDKERATLNGTDLPKLVSGASVAWPIPFASIITLVPFADAKLPTPPEQTPKSPVSFAGFIKAPAPAKAGSYKITLSSEGWVDVIQGGHTVKSTAFSGAQGCEGIRKSVKFNLAAAPFILELSSIPADTIKIVIAPE
ncbi:MAG TPA: hypothetical protein VH206_07660 [Xanthobacteraceae bacterium]|nr:hypothetical protein [Xanthobacteraceae bacterium]